MIDFTKAFAPIMLVEEVPITISRSDYGRIVKDGPNATYKYNGVVYNVSYDPANDRYYFTDGDTVYIIDYQD